LIVMFLNVLYNKKILMQGKVSYETNTCTLTLPTSARYWGRTKARLGEKMHPERMDTMQHQHDGRAMAKLAEAACLFASSL